MASHTEASTLHKRCICGLVKLSPRALPVLRLNHAQQLRNFKHLAQNKNLGTFTGGAESFAARAEYPAADTASRPGARLARAPIAHPPSSTRRQRALTTRTGHAA